ncbi:hypothetical protein CBS147343_7199 [Aspergillus niger]|nr:hypothetical protein CBS147343_7199 [Aspergillus niger]
MDEGQSSTIARLATIDRHYSLFPNQQHIEEQPYLCLPISGSCTAVRKGAWFCAAPPHLAAIRVVPNNGRVSSKPLHSSDSLHTSRPEKQAF